MSSLAARSGLTLKVLHYTINTRIEVSFEAHFTCLRELDMTLRHYQDADQIMLDIAQHCRQLEILIQRNCDRCTDASVLALATHSMQLKQLSFAAEVATMITHCKQLTSLKLGEPFLSRWDVALNAIAEQLKCLKELYLSGYHLAVTDTAVLHVVTMCKSLQILHIQNPHYVCKDDAIVLAMDSCYGSHMKEFHVPSCTVRVYGALMTLAHQRAVVKQDFSCNARLNVPVGCCWSTQIFL
eukprot:gene22869-25903_t